MMRSHTLLCEGCPADHLELLGKQDAGEGGAAVEGVPAKGRDSGVEQIDRHQLLAPGANEASKERED